MNDVRRNGYPVLATVLGLSFLFHALALFMEYAGSSVTNGTAFLSLLRMHPERLFARGEYWRPFTAPFVHADGPQLIINGTVLILLGRDLERLWGSFRFGLMLAAAGLGSSLAAPLAAWDTPTGGSTGFVLTLFAAYGARFGGRKLSGGFRVRHLTVLGLLAAVGSIYRSPATPLGAYLIPIGGLFGGAAYLILEPRIQTARAREDRRRRLLRRRAMRQIRQRVDFLLEKIKAGGMDALTPRERDFLADASRMYRQEKEEVAAPEGDLPGALAERGQ